MLGVALFFIGAVLVVNGVALTGRIEPRDAAGLNLLVGLLALLINLAGLVQASAPPQFFSSAGGLLFAFTYLYLAAVQWRGLQGAGLGWYCLFVAISALVYAGTSSDARFDQEDSNVSTNRLQSQAKPSNASAAESKCAASCCVKAAMGRDPSRHAIVSTLPSRCSIPGGNSFATQP